ncbi:MAG: peptidylprolyl isomerase [Gammaproteobacteria bacterium]|nr:MAG: peptidylprolyl isomerase [Gammaproteobacteria bacterium]
MKKFLSSLVIVAAGMGANLVVADEMALELNTEQEKISYSIGYDFGVKISQGLEDLTFEVFLKAVEDAYRGKQSLISKQEMASVIEEYRRKKIEEKRAEAAQIGERNQTEEKEFLAANAKKDGVLVTDSGLQYRIVSAGTGERPKSTDTVEVHYRGELINGQEFDSSYSRGQTTEFPVTRVIPGWTEALQLMKVGAKWELFIPAKLAYGERGQGAITPNSLLIFTIELVDIKSKG